MTPVMGEVARAVNRFSIHRLGGGGPAFSGRTGQIDHRDPETPWSNEGSLRVAAVWIATTVLADEVSSISWRMLERDNVSRVPVQPRQLEGVWGRPNSDQTQMGVIATETLSLALDGVVYEMLGWTRAGVLAERWPQAREDCALDRPEPGVLRLRVAGKGELVNRPGQRPEFMYIPRYTLPGRLEPVSPVRVAAQLLGLAADYDRMAARLARRGFNPSAVITVDGVELDNTTAREYAQRIERVHGGPNAAGRVAVFAGKDTKVEPWMMSMVDAQFIAQVDRVFDVLLAMWRVPPTVAGMVNKPSTWGSGVAEFARGLERFTLRPIVELLQDGYESYMLHPVDNRLQWRGVFDSLMSASPVDRANVQRLRMMHGMTSVERVLAQNDEPPFGEDETVYTQLALATEEDRRVDRLKKQAEAYTALVNAGASSEAAAAASGFDPTTFGGTFGAEA